ncbi:MAG: ribbon-helix-helix protein, CopG family [Eubacterium sp.]
MEEKLKLTKKFKGEDNHKTISIRFTNDIINRLDKLAAETGRSRNELVNILLDFAIERCELIEESDLNKVENSDNTSD